MPENLPNQIQHDDHKINLLPRQTNTKYPFNQLPFPHGSE